MAERPNYYLLLDLEPSVHDPAAISARIEEKRREWSKQKGIPKFARQAQANLQLLDDVKELMADPARRTAEAAQAAQASAADLAAAREKEREAVLTRLDFFARQGGCTDEDLRDLAARSKGALSESEVRDLAKAKGIPIAAPDEPVARPMLEPATEQMITQQIVVAEVADLYALLGHSREEGARISTDALRDEANALEMALGRKGGRSAQGDARQKLAAIARTRVFGDAAARERYDNWLGRRVLAALDTDIDYCVERIGLLDKAAQETLVKKGREKGLDADVVRAYLLERAAEKGFKVQRTVTLDAAEMDQCGRCGALNPAGSNGICRNCKAALADKCPQCGHPVPTRLSVCGGCGCRTGDAPVVRKLLAEGQELDAAGEHGEAQQRYARGLGYWPKYRPLIEAKAASVATQEKRARARADIEKHLRARKFETGLAAIGVAEQAHGPAGFADLRKQAEAEVELARREVAEGDRLRANGRTDDAHARYAQALGRVADHTPAQHGLEACPPAAPSELTVTAMGQGYALRWKPSTSPGVVYRVLRRAGGRPHGAEEGERVGEIGGTSLEDPTVAAGTPWTWAVYALRTGIASTEAATSGPHLRAAEVEDLEAHAGDGTVTLTWTPPAGARAVEVRRKAGGPPEPGQGERLPGDLRSSADNNVKNGQIWGYRVTVVYADPVRPAGEVRTAGRTIEARPQPPPPAVNDLRADRRGTSVFLRWTPPTSGRVQIRRASSHPPVQAGTTLPLTRLDNLGALVPGAGPGSASAEVVSDGQTVFVPVTVDGGAAVVGAWVTVVDVPDVERLRARCTGGAIVLTWTWPAKVETVWIGWSHDGFPSAPDVGQGTRLSRAAYEKSAGWEIRARDAKRHYFGVWTQHGGTGAWSAGARVLETMGVVDAADYGLVRKTTGIFTTSTVGLDLVLASAGLRKLPPTVLVARAGQAPRDANDGTRILELPEQALPARVPIPRPWDGRECRLFFANPAHAEEIRLNPTTPMKLG